VADQTKIKLINFIIALRRLPPLSTLSGDEERILFELKAIWDKNGSLSVSDAYDLGEGKSSTTAYRLLMGLKNKGLVYIKVDNADKRKRLVTFTPLASKLFVALG
jgi:DNA-binding MarR family transcriptional regulator